MQAGPARSEEGDGLGAGLGVGDKLAGGDVVGVPLATVRDRPALARIVGTVRMCGARARCRRAERRFAVLPDGRDSRLLRL